MLVTTGTIAASLTLTSAGLIRSGTDEAGIFGVAGDLAGKSCSLSMRLEPFNSGIQQYAPSAYESTVFSDFNIVSGEPVPQPSGALVLGDRGGPCVRVGSDSASYRIVLSDFLSQGLRDRAFDPRCGPGRFQTDVRSGSEALMAFARRRTPYG
jgi:hypothetical protein